MMGPTRRLTARAAFALIVLIAGVGGAIVREATAIGVRRTSNVLESRVVTFPPTADYELRRIEGWNILVHKRLIEDHPELADQALTHLRHQLYQITRKIPADALERLRKVRFWVEEANPNTPCMAYHPNPDWLREHGMNPEKAGCVEVANVRNFLAWTLQQPWMVLHELAHAYHHQFLEKGFENESIKASYRSVMSSKLYDSVLRITGKQERAYASTNHKEYFAEQTESFFGTNDFYPFVTSELKQHDPGTHALLERVWGSREGIGQK